MRGESHVHCNIRHITIGEIRFFFFMIVTHDRNNDAFRVNITTTSFIFYADIVIRLHSVIYGIIIVIIIRSLMGRRRIVHGIPM